MKVADLSEIMRKAYYSLSSSEQKEAFLKEQAKMKNNAIRSASVAIMTRNLSHGIAKRLKSNLLVNPF
jgi:hypothetical protein